MTSASRTETYLWAGVREEGKTENVHGIVPTLSDPEGATSCSMEKEVSVCAMCYVRIYVALEPRLGNLGGKSPGSSWSHFHLAFWLHFSICLLPLTFLRPRIEVLCILSWDFVCLQWEKQGRGCLLHCNQNQNPQETFYFFQCPVAFNH